MKPLLDITDVSLSYHSLSGETPALSHISFDLMPGEFLSIVIRYDHSSREASGSSHRQYRIYAAKGSSAGVADNL